jgi:hypothetical protein
MPLPDPRAALAADAVTTFGPDGTGYLTFLFADTTARSFDGGAALAATPPGSLAFGPASIAARGGLNVAGAAVDKGWLAADRGDTSPRRGTLYLSWHLNQPDFKAGTVSSTFWLASSRDGGRTFSDAVKVADAFSGQVAVRPDGTVDVIFGDRSGGRLLHATSIDGGRSFAAPDTVLVLAPGATYDVPHLLADRGGGLLVCWTETSGADSTRYRARCARATPGGGWEPPGDVVPDLPANSTLGFPVTAADGDDVWLLAYRADPDTTRVLLFRSSDGGRRFAEAHQLASRPFGGARFCPAAGARCRRAPVDSVFFPGDYFGLDAAAGRIAAAYVLPEGDAYSGRPTVFVSLVRP